MTENKEQSSIISQVECFKQGTMTALSMLNIDLIKCHFVDFNLASDHYISLVRSPRIDTIAKHKSKQQTHSVVSRVNI
jgi:hypothetical protein